MIPSILTGKRLHLLAVQVVLLFVLCIFDFASASAVREEADFKYEAPEPFPYLNGIVVNHSSNGSSSSSSGSSNNNFLRDIISPDPLVDSKWNENVNSSVLQIYRVNKPTKMVFDPPDAITWSGGSSSSLLVHKSCSIIIDWGIERAAWFEFISPNLAYVQQHSNYSVSVEASLSEFNSPYHGKTMPVKRYGNWTYRLETNDELYEGIRFTWLYFDFDNSTNNSTDDGADVVFEQTPSPIEISDISIVAKVKPVNYTGSFMSSDLELSEVWYTGAYGVRLNIEANGLGSVLIERGDRVAFQGDGHPTINAALVAFSPYELIGHVLNQTNSGPFHGHYVVDYYIMAYPIYWTMSVSSWFMASGEYEAFQYFVPDIMSILDLRVSDFLDPNLNIILMGWDDRLGNGWCFHKMNDTCTREAHLTFATLLIRACSDFARSLTLADMEQESQKYEAIAANLTKRFREIPEWPHGLGVHAAANAINARIGNFQEVNEMAQTTLNDPITICSWSQFNQYWILQGLGNANRMEHALASIKMCWGTTLKLSKGCFWEFSSPEWNSFMKDGDEAPIIPSYCHPWSSGVTAWLSHVLGGLQPLLPGYEEFVATPYVSRQYPTVSTTIKTSKYGPITVNASLAIQNIVSGGTVTVNTFIQTQVQGFVGLREQISAGEQDMEQNLCSLDETHPITINGANTLFFTVDSLGKPQDPAMIALKSHFNPVMTKALLFARISSSGSYTISAVYRCYGSLLRKKIQPDRNNLQKQHDHRERGVPHIPPFPPPQYAGLVSIDRETKGDGLNVYGSDGYMLLGYDNGEDRSQLPEYIDEIRIYRHGYHGIHQLQREFIGASKTNPVYIADPSSSSSQHVATHSNNDTSNENQRRLGMIGLDVTTGAQEDCVYVGVYFATTAQEGMMKFSKSEQRNYNFENEPTISIYSVSKTKENKHIIRVMDMDTLNVIAPTELISNYDEGVWWTLHRPTQNHNNDTTSSVRLRFCGIKGVHISAIAFASSSSLPLQEYTKL